MADSSEEASNRGETIAVVGGGLCGLTAARELARRGGAVTLFDKGRRVAGRTSIRRTDDGHRFDHGAQYFTVKDDRFRAEVERWLAGGDAAEWEGRFAAVTVDGEGAHQDPTPSPKRRYVGVPGMNTPARRLADEASAAGATVETGVRVASLKNASRRWRLTAEGGEPLGDFDVVLVTAPAPQAAELLTASPALANAAKSVRVTGCWAAMIALRTPVAAPMDGLFVNGEASTTPLSWAARDSSKPGRRSDDAAADRWVLHGSPAWSEQRIETDSETAAAELLDGFRRLLDEPLPERTYVAAHRWRYALPETPLEDRVLADVDRRLYAGGDWCGGPRVEGAFLSGLAAAEAILEA